MAFKKWIDRNCISVNDRRTEYNAGDVCSLVVDETRGVLFRKIDALTGSVGVSRMF